VRDRKKARNCEDSVNSRTNGHLAYPGVVKTTLGGS
jgi:hypothetical protein